MPHRRHWRLRRHQRWTPNLNQLAATGVRFEHAYTPQALCAPARASILTGLYPHAHGMRYNPYPPGPSAPTHSNFPEPVIDPFRDTRFHLWDNFVYYLSNAGYATACIGKWHSEPGNPGFFDTLKHSTRFCVTGLVSLTNPHTVRTSRPTKVFALSRQMLVAHGSCTGPLAPHEPLGPAKTVGHQIRQPGTCGFTTPRLRIWTGMPAGSSRLFCRHHLLDNTLIIFAHPSPKGRDLNPEQVNRRH